MSNLEFPSDRRYTKDHEWARKQGDEIVVGVSSFAVEQLGDITLVNIDVKDGDTVEAGKAFGTVESVKACNDLFAPVSGTVSGINAELNDKPELLNEDAHGRGWMIRIKPSKSAEFDALLDLAAYQKVVASSEH